MTISGTLPITGKKATKELMEVVLGNAKADLAIVNARLANVYTGELLENYAVTIKGKLIAYMGREPKDSIGAETVVIDAEGMTIIPGFIDGHCHMAHTYGAAEFLRFPMRGGTTTLIGETMDALPIGGYEAVLDFLGSFSEQPIKVFGTIPAMVSISKTCNGIPMETLKKLLPRDDIIGLGESYWQAVLKDPDQFLPLYEETLRSGKMIEGHSAGASGKKLMAYAAMGVSSCHEPINVEQVLERLRLGFYVMVREGSVRRELETVAPLKDMDIDLRRLILATDGVDPSDLISMGYMEYVVQKAIDVGFDPMAAVQMATINVAEHFSLDGILGGIAPGKYADMVIIPDLKTIRPQYVISNGMIVVKNGELLVSPRKHVYTEASCNSIHLPAIFKAWDFSLPIKTGVANIKVRVIDQVTELVTAELILDMPVLNGEINADLDRDIIKVAAIDRTHCPGRTFVGLLRGFHLQMGAFATSATWDTSDIVVVGASDEDMAFAVNRIHALQGGVVVCNGGKIIMELPLPVMGIISLLPVETLAAKIVEIGEAVRGLGVTFSNPFLTLITLTCAAIPYLRICEEGLVNLREGKTLGLVVE